MALKDSDDVKTETEDADISLDMSQAAVKKMISDARERGYITIDQINSVLPPEHSSSEQIEDIMSMLSEMGINVIEEEEHDEPEEGAVGGEVVEASTSREIALAGTATETLDRTDDPVRMYLREMGSVELLSREGEIAIAKRIEAGRNTMIAGLCESPLTFQAITIWRDELLSEEILLRDVIDLEPPSAAALTATKRWKARRLTTSPWARPPPRAAAPAESRNWMPTATRSCARTPRMTTTKAPTSRSPRWRPPSSPRCSRRSR